MASIASAVERFKRNPSILLDPKWITDACEFAEYRWRGFKGFKEASKASKRLQRGQTY